MSATGLCALNDTPLNTVALVHDFVELKCSSTLPTPGDYVSWQYQAPHQAVWQEVVHGPGLVVDKYKSRYEFNKEPADHMQSLIIRNVTFEHAGVYKCLDEGASESAIRRGHVASAQLIVLDRHLNCKHNIPESGVVGGDICALGLQAEYINVTCNICMRGNVAPHLEWRVNNESDDDVIISQATGYNANSEATFSLGLRVSDKLSGSKVSCMTTMLNSSEWIYSQELNLIWVSPEIQLLCK